MNNQLPKGLREIKTIQDGWRLLKERILKKLPDIRPQRKKDIIARALSFSRTNKNILVIIADPKTDNIIASYNNHYSAAKVGVTKYLHRKKNIVRALIERNENDKELEKKTNEFLGFMDAFLFKMTQSIKAEQTNKTKKENLCQEKKQFQPQLQSQK